MPVNDLYQGKYDSAQLLEVAVAVSFNGISHAVMMVSPQHLKDFALGFALSEGLIYSVNEVLDIVVSSHACGWQVDLQVLARTQYRLKQRRRTMAGPSGCGLCGVDSIEEAMTLGLKGNANKALDKKPSEVVIMKAREALSSLQQANNGMRGNHCAAYFDLSANAIAYREDVGRHSALDKLLGCLSKKEYCIADGFALITSRCSHDLIAKAARLFLGTLVTLAQPTDLAVSSARKAEIALFCFQYGQLKRFS